MHTCKSLTVGIVLAAGLIASPAGTAAGASILEYPYIYKSTRAMGMGGAYTAIGGKVDTLFYNPAGLTNIPKDKGWEVNLLNLSAEAGEHAIGFFEDFQTALDTGDLNNDGSTDDDQLRAVNDLLAANQGRNIHVRAADFTSFGRSYDSLAVGFGAVGSARLDAVPHQGFGPDGLLEINADATYGALGGVSFPLGSSFFAGASVKTLHRESLVHSFSARELVDNQDSLDSYITNELRTKGDAVGFDAGLLWKPSAESWLRPSLGLSVMNIGDLDFGDAGVIPMTVNAGVAVNPRIPFFRSLIVGADVVDVTKELDQDKDLAKRLRYGAELQLFDTKLLELAVRAGMYEGYPTLGAEVRTLIFSLSYAMYSEELGAYAGQDRDKRHLLTLVLGW
jgi:hypothetical protein